MSREDVRTNLASWEADSAAYQERHAGQLNRWDTPLVWGGWNIPEEEVGALGDVAGLRALELGCGACQFGIKVQRLGAAVIGLDFSPNQLGSGLANMDTAGIRFPLVRASAEELPFADASFDVVFCYHGATRSPTRPSRSPKPHACFGRPGGSRSTS